MKDNKHIVIIGAGVMGASTAFFLSKSLSCSVTVIEKTSIACAASGKSGGFLALDWNDHSNYLSKFSRASFRLHQELAQTLEGAKNYGYRALETYSITFGKGGKSNRLVEWVNPHISAEKIGTKETTAQLTPELFTHTLLKEAEKTGRVQVREGQGVAELLLEGSTCQGVILEDGTKIEADQVVIAMGPWSGQLPLPWAKIPVDGTHVHSIVLDHEVPGTALFTSISHESKAFEPEVYPRSDGTVYICGSSDKEPLPPSADQVPVSSESIDSLISQAGLISNRLSEAHVLKRQACYLPVSATGTPLIGPHAVCSGLFLATGHSFWGILNSPITGKMLSEWLLDGKVRCLPEEVVDFFIPK
ncbi:FAD dependent oxidoreductase [Sporodiniella umbellata]|nr:FAD dependent oxidoreductase [Sporodiniella umbellata]